MPGYHLIGCGYARAVPILACVMGEDFAGALAAAQDGDEAAFAVLWRDGNPALLRYLRAVAPDAAEDIAAETWVQVVRGLAGFCGDEQSWRSWLFTTARRRAIDESRRRSRHRTTPLAEVLGTREPRMADAAGLAMENMGTAAAIAVISALPPPQAEVILLRVLAGLDTEAVARIVGKSPGAVRVAAHRGLRRLARTFAVTGVTL
jgi:RNA polymerase sigma-70 factor, ECF subfamily